MSEIETIINQTLRTFSPLPLYKTLLITDFFCPFLYIYCKFYRLPLQFYHFKQKFMQYYIDFVFEEASPFLLPPQAIFQIENT